MSSDDDNVPDYTETVLREGQVLAMMADEGEFFIGRYQRNKKTGAEEILWYDTKEPTKKAKRRYFLTDGTDALDRRCILDVNVALQATKKTAVMSGVEIARLTKIRKEYASGDESQRARKEAEEAAAAEQEKGKRKGTKKRSRGVSSGSDSDSDSDDVRVERKAKRQKKEKKERKPKRGDIDERGHTTGNGTEQKTTGPPAAPMAIATNGAKPVDEGAVGGVTAPVSKAASAQEGGAASRKRNARVLDYSSSDGDAPLVTGAKKRKPSAAEPPKPSPKVTPAQAAPIAPPPPERTKRTRTTRELTAEEKKLAKLLEAEEADDEDYSPEGDQDDANSGTIPESALSSQADTMPHEKPPPTPAERTPSASRTTPQHTPIQARAAPGRAWQHRSAGGTGRRPVEQLHTLLTAEALTRFEQGQLPPKVRVVTRLQEFVLEQTYLASQGSLEAPEPWGEGLATQQSVDPSACEIVATRSRTQVLAARQREQEHTRDRVLRELREGAGTDHQPAALGASRHTPVPGALSRFRSAYKAAITTALLAAVVAGVHDAHGQLHPHTAAAP